MSTELELKFLMPQAQLSQLVTLLPQLGQIRQHDTAALLNAYFDTADNWFRRHDMGLRSRLKRGRYEQTIKLAGRQHGALQQRPEYNQACATVVPQLADFPDHIWPAATDIDALQHKLNELFRTDFSRQSWQLHCHDGTVIELVYDQGQVIAAEQIQLIAELELELISGDAGQLFVLAQQLLQQLPLRTGWLSKAARGYLLSQRQSLALPQTVGTTLLQHITALQQAEACFAQQQNPAALNIAADALAALSQQLAAIPALAQHSTAAHSLAQQLARQQSPQNDLFATRDYNLLLLQVSHYLFDQA
jgi:triphosphatase